MGEMSLLILPYGRIYASEYRVGIRSDNGLSPIRRQAIILTNAGLLSFEPLGTNFCEILIKIQIQIQIQIFYWLTKRDRLYQQYKQQLKHTRIHKKTRKWYKMKDVKGWRSIDSCLWGRCSDIMYTKNVIWFIYYWHSFE